MFERIAEDRLVLKLSHRVEPEDLILNPNNFIFATITTISTKAKSTYSNFLPLLQCNQKRST